MRINYNFILFPCRVLSYPRSYKLVAIQKGISTAEMAISVEHMNTDNKTPETYSEFDAAVDHIDRLLSKSEIPLLPEALKKNVEFCQLTQKIVEIRTILAEFSEGDFSFSITLRGYVGGALKALQSNTRHLAWQMQKIAMGDFSQKVEFMGDFAHSFNQMLKTLKETYDELKCREQKMAELAASLGQEIERRVEIEEILRQSEEEYRRLATIDFLTGVCNRRYFYTLADREMDRMRRSERGMCLAMIDVDHFKGVNDRFGHLNGDIVLSCLAKAIVTNVRAIDIVARYGGEEFIVLLPDTPFKAGCVTLERLREVISRMPIILDSIPATITISIGMTYLDPLSSQGDQRKILETAIEHADEALYRAKASGRNCLECDIVHA